MTSQISVPAVVMERVNAEITRSIMETPEYIQSIVTNLLQEAQTNKHGYSYNDPDNGKPFFEVLLRQQLRSMVRESVSNLLKDRYKDKIDEVIKEAVGKEEKLDGTLANAFARLLADEYKLTVNTEFRLEKES